MKELMQIVTRLVLASLLFGLWSGTLFAGKNDNNNATSSELLITEVQVTYGDSGVCTDGFDTITIRGVNFDNGTDPTVVLGDQGALTVCFVAGDEIVAECPGDGFCEDGDYLLEVVTGNAVKNYDDFDLTIGAVGPPGKVGPRGEKGDPGADSTVPGPQGIQGEKGEKGEKGDPGADSTVPGPRGIQGETGADSTVPGPQGPAGVSGYEVIRKSGTIAALAFEQNIIISCPSGKRGLGSGEFFGSLHILNDNGHLTSQNPVIYSHPTFNGSGQHWQFHIKNLVNADIKYDLYLTCVTVN